MLEKELTVAVLDKDEQLLGFLHPNEVNISENNKLYSIKTVDITHPIWIEGENDPAKYDNLLKAGNKIWRSQTCDNESILYVLSEDKVYDFIGNTITMTAYEVSRELGEYAIKRNAQFSWTPDSNLIENYCSPLFNAGAISGPQTITTYNGALSPLAILRAIENNTGGEYRFRYVYDTEKRIIRRYIDYLNQIGKTHTTPIELGYNATKIDLTVNENNVRVAAGPIGNPSSADATLNTALANFESAVFDVNTQIPLYVTKDEQGNEVNGPLAYPRYPKPAGQMYVESNIESEKVANYNYIQGQQNNSPASFPRIYLFSTTEENIYNLYWKCIENIEQYLQPEITLKATVVDLNKLTGNESEYYNTGDTVYVRLPGRTELVQARVSETTKNPRNPESDQITISSYITSFTKEFYGSYYKSAGHINI